MLVNNEESKEELGKQNKNTKIVRISGLPKGVTEMKNIIYRVKEKRYTGRKMINGHRLTVYAKTQADCVTKLKQKINSLKKQAVQKTETKQLLLKNLFMQWFETEKAPFLSKGAKEDILQVYKHLQPF